MDSIEKTSPAELEQFQSQQPTQPLGASPERAPKETSARELIIEEATRLFAKKGLAGTSVREIAKVCGLNLSLISYYFGGKEGLYQTILREHFQNVRAQISTRLEEIPHLTREAFGQEIERLISTIIEIRVHSPFFCMLMQREHLMGMPFAREVHEELMGPVAEKWYQLMARAQAQGIIKPDIDPRSFFVLMLQSIWGYFIMESCQLKSTKGVFDLPKDKEDFKKFVMKVFLEGISR